MLFGACQPTQKDEAMMTFQSDLEFLQSHLDILLLHDADHTAQVAISPELQGRVLTSTARGPEGLSYGWINRELIASGENNPHMNAFGGEDRFWMGPEGGQFSIFFKADTPFDLEHWFTPPPVNEVAYTVRAHDDTSVTFAKSFTLTNYSNTVFQVQLDRTISLIPPTVALNHLKLDPTLDVDMVAFESDNRITNAGDQAWVKETGLLSIWIVGMFRPSPGVTIVLPYTPGPESERGPVVNDAYFGPVPKERLRIGDEAVYFSGDGKYRSKIGLTPQRSRPVIGSYDTDHNVLTLVQFSLPTPLQDYVNSMWEIQDEPYSGDTVNSYNDGPPAPGAKPLGPFYELETSSPAAALNPGEQADHLHRTFHFQGDPETLDRIARHTLGVDLDTITSALE
jgi:hypothetical protein